MRKFTFIAIFLAVAIAAPSFAVTRTWTGATNANWSESTNWSPAGVPDVSDTLVLGANPLHLDMNNDLPPGTLIGPISIPTFDRFTLSGNSLVLTGQVTGNAAPIRWDVDLKMEADVTLPGTAYNGTIDVNGHSVTLYARPTTQFSPPTPIGLIVGTGILTISGASAKINQSSTFTGTVHVDNSCELAASMPNADFIVEPFRQLSGEGTIGSASVGGDIGPGVRKFNSSTLRTFRTKSISIDGGYEVDVNYPIVLSDRLEVTGTVTLSGSLYPSLFLPITPPPSGTEVVIIDNDGADPVIGTFHDLPEGALISADGFTMRVSYHGGDGNDVTLTNVAYGKIWTDVCRSAKWSDPCSWSPASMPVSGEVLAFGPVPLSGSYPQNDLPAGFVVGGLTLNGYTIEGNPITLMGDVTAGVLGGQLSMPVTLGTAVHFRCPYLGTVNVNGQTATFEGLTVIAELNGSGTVPPANLYVANGTFSSTLSGSLTLGSLPNANIAGSTQVRGYLFDTQLANVVIEVAGTIDPGPAAISPPAFVGTISATSLSLAGTYDCDLDGNAADQIIVTGPVSLSGPLNVVVRKAGQTAPFFKIIENRGLAPISGTFSGLPEGATVQAGSSTFTITYRGGDGNDVVLLSEPAPTVALSQSSPDSVFGELFTVRASVSGRGSVVTFNDGSVLLGSATPSVGVVTMDVANLNVGTHQITAAFDTATATMTHSVKRGATALTVTGSIGIGQGVAVKVVVRPVAPAAGGPSGLVTIEVDGATIGSAPLVSGTATITTLPLAFGRHTMAVHYAGDPSFEPGNGSSEVVIVPARGRSVRH